MSREKKFTLGPWEAKIRASDSEIGIAAGGTSNPKWDIARSYKVDDANLIAAAPELLKELESHCRQCMARNKWSSCSGCFTQRAIKKAYGEK